MRALCDTLEYEGYQTYGFTSASEALAAMRERPFDLLLADLQMPGTNGIDLMKSAQLVDPTLVAVIMTGHGALETAVAAMKAGALDYIQKPIKLATALPVLERALAVRQLRIEKKRLEAAKKQAERFGVHCETVKIEHPYPHETIIETATSRGCDLIVMGSRGLGGIRKLLLGSTTDRVVHHASIPVLTIRSGKLTKRRAHKDRSLRIAG